MPSAPCATSPVTDPAVVVVRPMRDNETDAVRALVLRAYAGDFELLQFDIGRFRLELIADASGTSFVRRFLDKRGEGFHHLSIDVDELDPVLERMEADGVRIVDRADIGNGFKTAFVSPRSAHGVLIQFWQVPEIETPNW